MDLSGYEERQGRASNTVLLIYTSEHQLPWVYERASVYRKQNKTVEIWREMIERSIVSRMGRSVRGTGVCGV